jgi:hypothetical protein
MSKIQLAPNLTLPLDIAGETIGILGIRGSGKTNTAGVLAEELLDRHYPIVVIDPTDAWWGLRSKYPVFIFGGQHGDLPLAETDGDTIAEFVVHEGVSVILSTSLLGGLSAQRRFVSAFNLKLFELKSKAKRRSPLTVIIDEAPLFIPQKATGEAARVVHSVENFVSRGRNKGFGVVLISQRSATINKDVLTMADTMIVHRMTGLPDRKVMTEWMDVKASAGEYKEALAGLAGLGKGEAWVWSPAIDLFKKVQIRARHTFDSSASPKMGKRLKPPKNLAKIDLGKLQAKMVAAVERKKQEDPKLLRDEIAVLKKALKDMAVRLDMSVLREKDAKPAKAPKPKAVSPAFTRALIAISKLPALHSKMATAQQSLNHEMGRILHVLENSVSPPTMIDTSSIPRNLPPMSGKLLLAPYQGRAISMGTAKTMRTAADVLLGNGKAQIPLKTLSEPVPEGGIDTQARKLLDAAIVRLPASYSRSALCAAAGCSNRSSTTSISLAQLKRLGFLLEQNGTFTAMQAGLDYLGAATPVAPKTHEAMMEMWRGKLDEAAFLFLTILAKDRRVEWARSDLVQMAGRSERSSTTSIGLADIVRVGLAVRRGNTYQAADVLYPEG